MAKKILTAIIITLISSSSAFAFIDVIQDYLDGRVQDEHIPISVCGEDDAPVQVVKAEIVDKGTKLLKVKKLEHSFVTESVNNSDKEVLSYQLVWYRHLPFADYDVSETRINSVTPLEVGGTDKLIFRKPIHYRHDAYYEVCISKVMFADKEVWYSPTHYDVGGHWASIKQELESLE